ncbi:MAG TPA: ATP-binding protein [Kofleriaceae bacterium]|nr:ATP-binding protein [Kofleriaceae bacterium]
MNHCRCTLPHTPKRIVLTGGPGAGKTAVLELVRKSLCEHVRVLPESAGILFTGGFPRGTTPGLRRAAQRAIYYVQRELETIDGEAAIELCDRGTVDSLAYWPGPEDFFAGLGTSLTEQYARYHAVIHLRTPPPGNGYNQLNPLRIETPAEASAIDERIARAWAEHPQLYTVPASADFMAKATRALEIIHSELPPCCRA